MASNQMGDTPLHSTPIRVTEWRSRQGNDPKRKHISSPELMQNYCSKCENELGDQKIDCKNCKLYFCVRCSGLSNKVMELILSGVLDDYRFLCKSCKHTVPTLEKIDEKLTVLSQKQETRLTYLEQMVKKLDMNNEAIINEQMKEVKNDIMKNIKQDVTKMIDDRSKEMEDRRRRELNIVVYNLKEGNNRTGKENQLEDERNLQLISNAIGLESLIIETSYRLGKKDPTKTRVLKVILVDRKQRKYLLNNSRFIKDKIPHFKDVVIFKDLTKEQR